MTPSVSHKNALQFWQKLRGAMMPVNPQAR
jgi:hypothetical protein